MTRLNKLALGAAVLIAAAAAGAWVARSLREPPPPAPTEVALPGLDGLTYRLEDWRGRVVVLNFWATWCPPCREEIPLLIDAQRRFGGRGVQVVGVALDDPGAVAAYYAASGINYPILLSEMDAVRLMQHYGNPSAALPFTVVLDRAGEPVARKLGAFHGKQLEEALLPLLGRP